MERMLRKKKDNSDYEIDRELTGKFAIEKNAEYQEKIEQLEEENKMLHEEQGKLHRLWSKDTKHIQELEEENKKLKEELKELEETLEHRDSVLSIMYDLLRSDLSDYEQLCMIDVVIDVEVGNEPQNKLREELLDRFWKRDF